MTAVFPGSAHIFARALLENYRICPDNENCIIYDCTMASKKSDGVIRGSLLYIDLTSSAPIHPGIYEVHAKVRRLLMNRTSFDSSPHRSFCISRLYTLKVPFTPISLSPCSEIFFL